MSVDGYPPHEQRYQMQERARFMRWQRSDWLQSVEDVIFQHTMLGVTAIHFSGDHRPMVSEENDA